MSIDYESNLHKFLPNKLNLKNTYQGFYPMKTFSKGIYHNIKILKLKNTMSNIFSHNNKDKSKNKTLSTPDQTNPISNNNTCYKTNGFSPNSTRSFFNPMKAIKEKNIRKKLPTNKKELLSMKYIGFVKYNKSGLNSNNHNCLKLVKKYKENKNDQIIYDNKKEINKENIKYIFVGGDGFYKNNKKKKITNNTNDLINKIENNFKIQKKLNSFSCPDIKLNNNLKNETSKEKEKNNFEIHNLFFESSHKEKEEILNQLDQVWSHTISNFGNINKNKGSSVGLKKKRKKLKKNRMIQTEDINKKITENKSEKNILKNKNGYELKADIEMFDPLTFIKNSNLYKDYLERKQREKILLKKLIKRKKIEQLMQKISQYKRIENNKVESKSLKNNEITNKSLDINYDLTDEIINSIDKDAFLKYLQKNSLMEDKDIISDEEEKKNQYKTYLKPSEYVHEIANKILEDIGFFRKKKYNDTNNPINEKNKKFISFLERKKLIKKNKQLISLKTDFSNNFILKLFPDSNNIKGKLKQSEEKNHQTEAGLFIKNEQNENKKQIMLNNHKDKREKSIRFKRNYELKLSEKFSKEKFWTIDSNENLFNERNNKIRNTKKTNSERIKIQKNSKRKISNIDEKQSKNNLNEFTNQEKNSKSNKNKNIYNNLLLKDRKNRQSIMGPKKNLKNVFDENKNEIQQKNIFNIEEYDEIFEFNENDLGDELVIVEEFKKIRLKEDLKNKLLENRELILKVINKSKKTKEDYRTLNFYKRRIQHIIKKLIEKMQKENLISKSKIYSFLPKTLKERKILYRYLRYLENKIKRQLEKDNQLLELSLSSSEMEREEENSNISGINFFSLFPIDPENNDKLKLEERIKNKKKPNLIYDNLYLFRNKNKNNKKVEIKQEVYDILKEKQEEGPIEEKKSNYSPGPVSIRPRKGKFTIKKRKFTKRNNKYNLKKLEDEKSEILIKEEKSNEEEKKLEKRLAKFYERIKKLKRGEIEIDDYEDELSELMMEQIDKVNYEEDKVKELRIFNFFRNFQMNRKGEIFGKNFLRQKLIFNSPVNFTFYPRIPKIKSSDSMRK